MPRISEFFGIVIYVYWRDHGPPHFHAVYGGEEVLVAIDDLSVLRGRVSPRALGLGDGVGKSPPKRSFTEPLSSIEPLR